ncbi:Na+/H+ antiporter subunit E [Sinisalibacter lacisalsi]|uniref:Cation:proton antiporter n=1 Tax=Sinisalibacter lacisalsi TaxID=1526570 RepID=A0ABQ1QU63_9RHOB|nr:Na+/H+ antiporter subunit E [Sinisalibacter lacisalsi]GGD46347.1 cation:proton antiporter [Sinisalibacter lacisalsi]
MADISSSRAAPRAAAIKLFATLFVFWLLLNGNAAPGTLAVGVVVAGAIVLLFPSSLSVLSGHRLTAEALVAALRFVGLFLRELVRANIAMAALVLNPRLPVAPALVKVRTRLTDPVARLLLANAISLTPGTLTVEIAGEWLYVHWVVAPTTDADEATRAIVSGFERHLEVMYG